MADVPTAVFSDEIERLNAAITDPQSAESRGFIPQDLSSWGRPEEGIDEDEVGYIPVF